LAVPGAGSPAGGVLHNTGHLACAGGHPSVGRAPVFFRQTRTGEDGQPFVPGKFRTTVAKRSRRSYTVPAPT